MAENIDENEKQLFLETVKNVKPIKKNKVSKIKSTTSKNTLAFKKPESEQIKHEKKLADYLKSNATIHPENMIETDIVREEELPNIRSDQVIEFYQSGLQKRLQLKFKQGKFPIEATLDLHGCDRTTAKISWQQFLADCLAHQVQHVLVIHGKGVRSQDIPILKNSVYLWLKAEKNVMAFCTAKRQDGGTGALYVRLKKIL